MSTLHFVRTPGYFHATFLVFLLLVITCCSKQQQSVSHETKTIVFKHGKMNGHYGDFVKLLGRFEQENPGILVKDEMLPSSTDEQHQFYVINLESKSTDFDVISLDVIWVPEFTRAGWLREVSHVLKPEELHDMFPGPLEAATTDGKLYAIPWYIDAGVLYYRKDLLKKHNRPVPRTWPELVETAEYITRKEKGLYGYVWQGKQYEGLMCNVLEFLWSNDGEVLRNENPVLNTTENIAALAFMHELIATFRVTPPQVTTATEEPSRHLFGSGKALFMRNWPYAWALLNRQDSAVKGKIGVAPLPAFPGHESSPALGGWQLAVNRYSKSPAEAEKFIRFLSSPASQKLLALTIGYNPTRRTLYKDHELQKKQPFMTSLHDIFMKARPRPVTPYYMMITQVLQPEFSAAISGIKTPADALASGQKQMEQIMGAGQ